MNRRQCFVANPLTAILFSERSRLSSLIRQAGIVMIGFGLCLAQTKTAHAQAKAPAATTPKAAAATTPPAVPPRPAPPTAAAQKKLPPLQNVGLRPTYDGVQLSATYYPSPLEKELAKEAVPVILLHQFKGSRADYNDLALALQKAGCAVLVPDLRGHGQSTRRMDADGKEKTIGPALMNKQDFEAMAYAGQDGGGDVEMCKAFLMEKNNAKELNIDKLCVVGAEMGAAVAIDWSARDWAWPVLPGRKQGQDVKAVVLLSPPWAFKGMAIGPAVTNRDFAGQVSWLLAVGEQDTKDLPEAKRMRQTLDRFLPASQTAASGPKVEYHQYPTSLDGTKLLGATSLSSDIVKFIDQQVAKSNHPWTDRKSPL